MPILAASCIGCSAERYAGSVFMQMALNVILQTCFGLQDRRNAFLSLCKIRRITLSASHKHGKTAPNSIRFSFLVLHFFLPMASTTALTMLWQKHALHCGKSRSYLGSGFANINTPPLYEVFWTGSRQRYTGKSANCHQSNRRTVWFGLARSETAPTHNQESSPFTQGWSFYDSMPKESRNTSDTHTIIRMDPFQPTSRLHPALMGWFQPNPSYMGWFQITSSCFFFKGSGFKSPPGSKSNIKTIQSFFYTDGQ